MLLADMQWEAEIDRKKRYFSIFSSGSLSFKQLQISFRLIVKSSFVNVSIKKLINWLKIWSSKSTVLKKEQGKYFPKRATFFFF